MVKVKGIVLVMLKCFNDIRSQVVELRWEDLYSSAFVQHIMRGISMQELLAGKAIYQPGTPRKVCTQ